MDDRFPRGMVIAIGAITILILIIGAFGLWEEGVIDLVPDDLVVRQKEKAGTAPQSSNPSELEPAERVVFRTPRRRPPVDITASWETLDIAPQETRRPGRLKPLNTSFFRTPLPEVRGRILVSTAKEDGPVTHAEVVHGSPLRLRILPSAGSRSILTYEGKGRHPRIVALLTGSGTRVLRFLNPRTLGGRIVSYAITPPGILKGTVKGKEATALKGATVRVGRATAVTDSRGRFELKGIRGTEVLVRVDAPGHAVHRDILTTPGTFGKPGSPAFRPVIQLQPGVQLTIQVHYPAGVKRPAEGHTFTLIPFGHQLRARTLATEALTRLVSPPDGVLVKVGFPVDQDMCLVGTHPERAFLYHLLKKSSRDLSLNLKAASLIEFTGKVFHRNTGEPVPVFSIATSCDDVTLGRFLGQSRKIPTGHRPGNYPLPVLDTPLVRKTKAGKNGFRITFDPMVASRMKLRFTAPGFQSETVQRIRLTQSRNIFLVPVTAPRRDLATIHLTVNLAGSPDIISLKCFGMKSASEPVKSPGRIEVRILEVPPGQYKLTLEAEGYETYTRTLNIMTGSTREVPAFLNPIQN